MDYADINRFLELSKDEIIDKYGFVLNGRTNTPHTEGLENSLRNTRIPLHIQTTDQPTVQRNHHKKSPFLLHGYGTASMDDE